MIKFKGLIKDYIRTYENKSIITIETSEQVSEEELFKIKNAEMGASVELAPYRQKRSISSNAYCWILCEKMARKIKNCTKEDVYRQIIRKVGVFEVLPIRADAVDTFKNRWESKGIGWVCEVMRESKIKGYINVFAYYGSSTYDTEEMSRLIDEIVSEAKELGIQTETPEEIAKMKSLYEQEKGGI